MKSTFCSNSDEIPSDHIPLFMQKQKKVQKSAKIFKKVKIISPKFFTKKTL